jgi:hypothetical protein
MFCLFGMIPINQRSSRDDAYSNAEVCHWHFYQVDNATHAPAKLGVVAVREHCIKGRTGTSKSP